MDDNCSRNKIAQPPVLLVAHHADQSHAVNAGNNVYSAHEVSSNALDRGHRTPALVDDANSRHPLAWCFSAPEDFKKRPPRKKWQHEHKNMPIFDAVMLGLAYSYSKN